MTRKRNFVPSTTPGGTRDSDGVVKQRFTASTARIARLRPGFTAPAAARARPMHWHLERHDKALARLSNGQPQFGGKHIAADAFAEKFVANALDHVIDRGKSIATSSAKHSLDTPGVRTAFHVTGNE